MEALVTIVERKELLARERQVGLTAGIDSGSSTTKAMIMRDNEIIGKFWHPDRGGRSRRAEEALEKALAEAGVNRDQLEAIGVTGYGRFTIGKKFNAKLVQEELTVNSKGAVWLADRQKGEATIIDIGGMDNKAITVRDGIPDNFTMGGICAGASGTFPGDDRQAPQGRHHRPGRAGGPGRLEQGADELLLLRYSASRTW